MRFNKERYLQHFVNFLLALSPHLRVLGLSGAGIEYEDDDDMRFLEAICSLYESRRGEADLPLLQLEELELGNGFQLGECSSAFRGPYLGQLTDLGCLRT